MSLRLMTVFWFLSLLSCKTMVLNVIQSYSSPKIQSIILNMKVHVDSSSPDFLKPGYSSRKACWFSSLTCFHSIGAEVV